jgi:hypothetical protein
MKNVVAALLLTAILFACSAPVRRIDHAALNQPALTLYFEPGPGWIHKMRIMPLVSIKNRPQIAVWTEDTAGNLVETLYVTGRTARNNWRGTKTGRPEALPVWACKTPTALPSSDRPLPDQITSATPKGGFSVASVKPSAPTSIWVEVNHSLDFNDAYPRRDHDVNGQPSLVYRCDFPVKVPHGTVELKPVGHGAVDGRDGSLDSDLSNMTGALLIMKKISMKW